MFINATVTPPTVHKQSAHQERHANQLLLISTRSQIVARWSVTPLPEQLQVTEFSHHHACSHAYHCHWSASPPVVGTISLVGMQIRHPRETTDTCSAAMPDTPPICLALNNTTWRGHIIAPVGRHGHTRPHFRIMKVRRPISRRHLPCYTSSTFVISHGVAVTPCHQYIRLAVSLFVLLRQKSINVRIRHKTSLVWPTGYVTPRLRRSSNACLSPCHATINFTRQLVTRPRSPPRHQCHVTSFAPSSLAPSTMVRYRWNVNVAATGRHTMLHTSVTLAAAGSVRNVTNRYNG